MAKCKANGWQSCPTGEFSRLAGRLSARRHRQSAAAIAFGVAAVLITGVAAAAATQYVVDVMTLPDLSHRSPRVLPCEPGPPPEPTGNSYR